MNIISFDPGELQNPHAIMVGTVSPRAIGWIATLNENGTNNVAPFSFFTVSSIRPMVIDFSIITPRDGREKDTLRNIRATKEFTCNVVTKGLAEAANKTSADLSYGEDESIYAGIRMIDSTMIAPRRIAESPINLECKLLQEISFGANPGAGTKIFGEVVKIHIDSRFLTEKNIVIASELKLVARLNESFWGEVCLLEMPDERIPR
jgi:flavin reductase (DIM6/NTAB) family NADH-FMN oxidoreductase RutF